MSKFMNFSIVIGASLVSITPFTSATAQDQSPPWSQADEYYSPSDMAAARSAVQKEHGGTTTYYVLADRLEYQSNDGDPLLVLDGQAWWGGDRNKLTFKSELEYDFNADEFEEAEFQALWTRPISRYFDVQAGIRHDFIAGADRTFGVLGVQGLATYWFEIDAALFVSDDGDVSARFEAEYELLLTQRLILQPRTELNLAIQSVEEIGVGSGLSTAAVGARLRYEFTRQFAPYVGVSWTRSIGETADFVRAVGEDPGGVSLVAGLRVWF
ncbi:copper resistance protein B [Hyphococcus lacteus]|uniref:Copper resistance protein B n=1 Tax=Hyphococcus lacteus TaxID=3143536 RepID=A0ABV3Z7L8_9PROT